MRDVRQIKLQASMIALNDPIWTELRHPYGAATEIPIQLRRIENAKRLSKRFWDDFGNTLCHQCSIGSASIAALPHLVRIAADNQGTRKAYNALDLAALILACATEPKNTIPKMEELLDTENPKFIAECAESLALPLKKAVDQGREVLAEMIFEKRKSYTDTMNYLAMVAAFDLRADAAAVLWGLRYERFDCPRCENEVSVHELYSY